MGRTEFLTWKTITSEPTVGKGNTINESEMALFFECMQQCARKVLDTGRHCQRGDFSTTILSRRRQLSGLQSGKAEADIFNTDK
jgi:hypothetical protein